MSESKICKWFSGKNILLTGATGFIGKVLLAKLLQCCDDIECIYLIIRAKNKHNFAERCEKFLENVAFSRIRESKPHMFRKIKFVEGNIEYESLGLSNEMLMEIVEKVTVVIHNAANVKFDLTLKEAVTSNLIGSIRVMELVQKIVKLEVLVYVSTAYSQIGVGVLEEKPYKSAMNAETVLKLCERFDDELIETLLPKILDDFPNTYAFSKNLSEDYLNRFYNHLPIVVIRPSVVGAAVSDPFHGFIDGLMGFGGISVGIGRGAIRSLLIDEKTKALYIPVDIVANAIISSIWLKAGRGAKSNEINFYNVSVSNDCAITWSQVRYFLLKYIEATPYDFSLGVPYCCLTRITYYYWIRVFFLQVIPALLIDGILILLGKNPLLMKVQRRIIKGWNSLIHFVSYPYCFDTRKFLQIKFQLNETDRNLFNLNVDKIQPKELVLTLKYGCRKFILKEKDENIPRAKKVLNILTTVQFLVKGYICYLLIKLFWSHINSNFY